MRSQYADKFSHDDEAAGYDADVQDTTHPVREGYPEVLPWVAAQAAVTPESVVVDLGAGTGNLSLQLPPCRELICVDVALKMLDVAREKLADRDRVRYVHADLLEFFDDGPACDVVVSTYAIHHLTPDEKRALFARIRDCLRSGGRAVFGDLMFENAAARETILAEYGAAGQSELADEIEDEFFWDVEEAVSDLTTLNFRATTRRFSPLSWGIRAERT